MFSDTHQWPVLTAACSSSFARRLTQSTATASDTTHHRVYAPRALQWPTRLRCFTRTAISSRSFLDAARPAVWHARNHPGLLVPGPTGLRRDSPIMGQLPMVRLPILIALLIMTTLLPRWTKPITTWPCRKTTTMRLMAEAQHDRQALPLPSLSHTHCHLCARQQSMISRTTLKRMAGTWT